MGRGLDGFLMLGGDCAVLKDRVSGLSSFSGGFGEGETPLPIPNRAVKPLSADGTWLARAWESRTPPVFHGRGAVRRPVAARGWPHGRCSRAGAPPRRRCRRRGRAVARAPTDPDGE